MASTQRNPAGALPLVSVVIPLFNAAADLDGLLDCLARQNYPIDRVEYLLVDNASRDRTAVLLQAAAQMQPNLQPLSQPQIQSSYAARNVGIQAAKGEIIAFTDADCRPHPDWLSRLTAPFGDRSVGLVAGEITALPGRTLLEQFADRQAFLSQRHTLAHPQPYGQTANLAVRRSIFAEIGLFRSYLTTGGDADFCWRVQQQTHWRLAFAPDAIVQHRHRSRLSELREQWQRYGQSNRYLHDLHGVGLAPRLDALDYLYRCGRWLIKEVPIALIERRWAELLDTPLHLVCVQARSQGQQRSHLPPEARSIDRLTEVQMAESRTTEARMTCGTRRGKPPD